MRRLKNSIKKRFGKYVDYAFEYPLGELEGDTVFSIEKSVEVEQGIPPIVYQTWKDNKFGKTHLQSLKKFRERNKDLQFCFLDDGEQHAYMERVWGDHDIYKIYNGSLFGPMVVDIFRYCLIYERGEYYFDISKAVNVPLTSLHGAASRGILCYEEGYHNILPAPRLLDRLGYPDKYVAQWGFGFEKESPFLGRVIENICEYAPHFANKTYQRPKRQIIQLTGPGIFTKSYWEALDADPELQIDEIGVEFNGHGDRYIPGSHVRYLTIPFYDYSRDMKILEL